MRKDRREAALGLSQKELEVDKYELIKFVIEDNNLKKEKIDKESVKITLRAKKEEEVKDLDQHILKVKNEMEKDKNKLIDAVKYREFLLSLDKEFAYKLD